MRPPALVAAGSDAVDASRERDVPLGEPFHVMRREDDFDAIVDVEPFGMVVHLLRHERHLAHECPGFTKGPEVKHLADCVAIFHLAPAAQLLDGLVPMRTHKTLDHLASPRLALSQTEVADRTLKIKRGA